VWGLSSAMNLMFDSLARCDPAEFAVPRRRSRRLPDLFEGFDD